MAAVRLEFCSRHHKAITTTTEEVRNEGRKRGQGEEEREKERSQKKTSARFRSNSFLNFRALPEAEMNFKDYLLDHQIDVIHKCHGLNVKCLVQAH